MAEVATVGDLTTETSTKEIISDLERRYIAFLQPKIASLEQQLATGDGDSSSESQKRGGIVSAENKRTKASKDAVQAVGPQNDKNTAIKEQTRYPVVLSKWDSNRGENIDKDAPKEKKELGPPTESPRAFTYRKITATHPRGITEYQTGEVEIEFEPLQLLLGKITSKWGWPDKVTQCRIPYSGLIWSWKDAMDEASKIVEDDKDRQARMDLAELLNIISTSSGHPATDRYFKEKKTMETEKSITHNALWTLFPPGTLILAQPFLEEPQIFLVQSCYIPLRSESNDKFDLVCYSFDWNGTEFNRVPVEVSIEYWGGDRRSIVELPFYPHQYYQGPSFNTDDGTSNKDAIDELKQRLMKRGQKYRRFCIAEKGKQMFNYDGIAHFQKSGGILQQISSQSYERDRRTDARFSSSASAEVKISPENGSSRKQIKGPVIVDFLSFFEYQSSKTPILGQLQRYEGQLESLSPERRVKKEFQEIYKFQWDKHPRNKELSDEQLLLCPPRVLGYALKEKKWAQLLVENLKDPDAGDAGTFHEKLQLENVHKELIEKSVLAHKKGQERVDGEFKRSLEDFAPDKGKGLIIMLYGLPGVGKTLTAESVALMTGKPLFSIGVSDIGIDGDKVETNLQKVFDLAGIWEAILLFDEADVFLEARRDDGEDNLQRNAMVSVLLRVLEYYDGILILTTNRIRSFDIAVQSRIHIAIKYQELSPEQKVKIFMSFIEQLHNKHQVADYEDLKKWVKSFGKDYAFNGRQIRNVVSTALGLALMEETGRKLSREHIDRVARQTEKFKIDLAAQEAVFKSNHG